MAALDEVIVVHTLLFSARRKRRRGHSADLNDQKRKQIPTQVSGALLSPAVNSGFSATSQCTWLCVHADQDSFRFGARVDAEKFLCALDQKTRNQRKDTGKITKAK